MRIRINISVLLILSFILFISCEEERPVKSKKRFTSEKKAEPKKQENIQSEVEKKDPNIFTVSQDQYQNYEMELGEASLVVVNQSITAAGYIEVPKEGKAEVRSYIGGYLRSTPLLPGDYVKKGQLLISLENLEYIQLQQDYLQARDQMTYLKTVYDRKKTLAEEQITSQNSMQLAESEYNSALANYEGLRKMLQMINLNPDNIRPDNISSYINLYSPMDGYLTLVKAVKGMYAEPTDVIFEIINPDHLHLELKVYEKDILKIKKGQKISFRIPESNSTTYTGEVFLVGKTIEGEDKTVTVHCHITDDNDLPAIAGMYIEAEIYFETAERFCLPVDAFLREENNYFVFVVKSATEEGYVFEKTKVEVGQVNEDCVEIVSTSKQMLEGKQILIEGAYDL